MLLAGTSKADVIYSIPLKGEEHQVGNMLEWSTAFEDESQLFIVEKSWDGVQFESAGIIDAAGHSIDEKGYRFLDVGVNDKQLFYRLKQQDNDGTTSYSETIMVKKEHANRFMVVTMGHTTVSTTFETTVDVIEDAKIKCIIKNKKGEVVKEEERDVLFGLNNLSFNLENEKEGTYIISLRIDQEEERLVIRKVDDAIRKKENVASKKPANGG